MTGAEEGKKDTFFQRFYTEERGQKYCFLIGTNYYDMLLYVLPELIV